MQGNLGGPEESKLITRAQHGDREAYAALVTAYRERVINVVYRMNGDAPAAEDAAQVAFIRAWQKLPNLRPGSSFRNWLYRIAVNAAVDSYRQEKPALPYEDMALAAPASERPEAAFEQAERARQVRKAILALSPASRAVLVLREYEGLSYAEIAETLEIPSGTVMSRLAYARSKLLEQLQGLLEEA